MKRLILVAVFLSSLLFADARRWTPPQPASGGGPTFTAISNNTAYNGGSSTTITVNATSVQAGDLVVLWACNYAGTTMTVSDGTSSLTGLTVTSSGANLTGQFFYLTSSVATGTVTYTVTYGVASTARAANVYVFRPSASCSFDTQASLSQAASGTAVTTNSITTGSGTVLTFAAQYNENAVNSSAETINSVTADGAIRTAVASTWYRATTSTYTGGGAATLAGSSRWCAISCSFRIP